jgi:integrase
MTLGDIRTLPLDVPHSSDQPSARKSARALQALCDQGKDPRQERAADRDAQEAARREMARQQMTLGAVWTRYLDAHRSRWGARHLLDHQKLAQLGGEPKKRGVGLTEPGPLAALLPVRLSDLTPQRVKAWLDNETATRPGRAALAFRLLRGFASWCDEQPELAGLMPEKALTSKDVRRSVPPPASKDDCLQREQLPLWFAAVRNLANPVQAAYLQTLLLTGARREELAALRWQDVDFRWRSVTIRDKVEGERTIPLTPYVSALLHALPRRNEWVFSSERAQNGRIREPRIAHNRALDEAGLPALSVHGLRRSFGTLSEWCEVPAGVVAQIMGHKPSAIAEKHYRRRPLDLLRRWHDQIEAWALEQAGIPFESGTATGAHLKLAS